MSDTFPVNAEKMRQRLLAVIQHKPISMRDCAREIGLYSLPTLTVFLHGGRKSLNFKNTMLMMNYIRKKEEEYGLQVPEDGF